MKDKLNILIANDDGIDSPGIVRLAEAASKFGNVWVAAPSSQCSGMSQKLTIFGEFPVSRPAFPVPVMDAWSIGGTPADCVKLAVNFLMPVKPDVVFSGILLAPDHIHIKQGHVPLLQGHAAVIHQKLALTGIDILQVYIGMDIIGHIRKTGILPDQHLRFLQLGQLKIQHVLSADPAVLHIFVPGAGRPGIIQIILLPGCDLPQKDIQLLSVHSRLNNLSFC